MIKCKDCYWLQRWLILIPPNPYCMSPKATDIDFVKHQMPFANIERMSGSNCGPNAINFKPK